MMLVAEALRGAASAGAETENVFLSDLNIHPCVACLKCHNNGICAQADDMAGLFEKMFASDTWILGTPVYWWGPTAQMKAFIDRWYAAIHHPERRVQMRRRVALISPFGDGGTGTARHIVGMLTDSLAYLKADFAGQLLVPSANKPGAVADRPEVMQEAYELGILMAKC
jgi:multimeric flavodoxin WrbA